ncbi:MAG: copper amine oxidase N-terminal domain-containing protein [Ruminococcaceae bacterium]|nr:copper amine oxidase N-terminal domain-containing protein [Oscillospiraceae bacterium]
MKKILSFALALVMLALAMPLYAAEGTAPADLPYITSDSVAFMDYNGGSDDASGSSASSAKKTFGSVRASGAIGLLANGGTLVISAKAYLAKNYTLPKLKTPMLITSTYGGTVYMNDTPASNPSCAFKMASGAQMTFESDVIIDDIIVFQEHPVATAFVVKSGATLVIGDGVKSMSKTGVKVQIIVENGGRAIIGGGDFDVVCQNGGEVVEGYTYDYLKVKQGETPKEDNSELINVPPAVGYIAYNSGNNNNDGLSPSTPKKSLLALNANGAMSVVAGGGTLVVTGRLYVGGDYTIPKLGSKLTITGEYGGTNYVNSDNVENPESGMIKMLSEKTLTIEGDVRLENIILFQENGQNTIKVANGGVLTIGDGVQNLTKQLYTMKLVVEAGGTLIFENADHGFDSIEGDGIVIMPETLEEEKTEVKLTIGSKTAYINGKAETLDAAPINRNNRTMLPVRFLANAFGVSNDGIKWDAATRTATLSNSETTIVVKIDAPSMTVNGLAVALDSPAIIENNRTYLPVRAIANALGVKNENIKWDAATNTATLVK